MHFHGTLRNISRAFQEHASLPVTGRQLCQTERLARLLGGNGRKKKNNTQLEGNPQCINLWKTRQRLNTARSCDRRGFEQCSWGICFIFQYAPVGVQNVKLMISVCFFVEMQTYMRLPGREEEKHHWEPWKPLQCCKWESTHAGFNTLLSSCLSSLFHCVACSCIVKPLDSVWHSFSRVTVLEFNSNGLFTEVEAD